MDGIGNVTFIEMSTLVNNASQLDTMIEADGRRLVQFFHGNRIME